MKPALDVFVASLRAGVYPSAREYEAVLLESGDLDEATARSLARRYQAAIPVRPSVDVLALLRSFSLRG